MEQGQLEHDAAVAELRTWAAANGVGQP
jgi:hypothetical protein